MGILKIIRNTNDGLDYMNNALNYVVNGHTDYDRRFSINTSLNNACRQFLWVKRYFGKTSGNPIFHFIVSYDAKSTWGDNYDKAEFFSNRIAEYFSDRYQVVWCIHRKPRSKKYGGCSSVYHAHFIVNSVSYVDGKMLGGSYAEISDFIQYIKNITGDNSWKTTYGTGKNGSEGNIDIEYK